jgi:hypothetical protein
MILTNLFSKIQKRQEMILNQNDKEKFLSKLQDFLSEIEFGRLYCHFAVSDKRLMYVDFKQEKSERIYFHGKPNNLED